MREDGLISMRVDTSGYAMELIYEPDASIDIDEIAAYADDATGGRCSEIRIFAGTTLVHHLYFAKTAGSKAEAEWIDMIDIADESGNE
jgi:hypothetical protein